VTHFVPIFDASVGGVIDIGLKQIDASVDDLRVTVLESANKIEELISQFGTSIEGILNTLVDEIKSFALENKTQTDAININVGEIINRVIATNDILGVIEDQTIQLSTIEADIRGTTDAINDFSSLFQEVKTLNAINVIGL